MVAGVVFDVGEAPAAYCKVCVRACACCTCCDVRSLPFAVFYTGRARESAEPEARHLRAPPCPELPLIHPVTRQRQPSPSRITRAQATGAGPSINNYKHDTTKLPAYIHWLQGFGRVAYSFQSSRYSFLDLTSYAGETLVPFADQIAKSAC